MTLKTRTSKVEMSLGPKEAFLLWLRQAHQFPSDRDYRRWLSTQPADAWPLVRMPKQVAAFTYGRMKDWGSECTRDAINRGHSEVATRFFLHDQLDRMVILQSGFLRLHAVLLLERILRLGSEKSLSELACETDSDIMGIGPRREQWSKDFWELHRQIEALSRTATLVSSRYFWGEPSLFPARARAIEELGGLVETLVGGFDAVFLEMAVEGTAPPPDATTFNLELAPSSAIESLAEGHIKDLRVMAKAQALEAMGDRDAAVTLTEKHMFH